MQLWPIGGNDLHTAYANRNLEQFQNSMCCHGKYCIPQFAKLDDRTVANTWGNELFYIQEHR